MASTEISSYTITNKNGVKLTCISLGATITSLQLPDGWEDLGSSFCMCNIFRIFFLSYIQHRHYTGIQGCRRWEKNGYYVIFFVQSQFFSLSHQPLKNSDYRTNSPYLGCSVGRVANRIRDAKFTIEDQTYTVSANVAPHTLHGGAVGFNKVITNSTTT